MSESFLIGEVARLSLSVADITGAVADPGGVVLRVKSGSAAITAYTYGADATIVRTARDMAHLQIRKLLEEGKPLPEELKGSAIFHAGPVALKEGDGWSQQCFKLTFDVVEIDIA